MAIAAVRVRPPLWVHSPMIDLRSDTITKPSLGMLKAITSAEVGDDVFSEDPTISRLEEMLADRFGMEAGLFCPSGTMTNQIAVMTHTKPGDEVICEFNCHVNFYEQGGMARNAGVSVNPIFGNRGVFTASDLKAKLRPIDEHFPKTKLVLAENTCNRGGGKVFPYPLLKEIRAVCDENNLKFHLDGARLYNAIVATSNSENDFGRIFDSISICLSKGLGCPVGSVLLGTYSFIDEARRARKVLGGGMRQAGVLAAAGIYAVENNIDRLTVDNKWAAEVGKILEQLSFVESILAPETNILIFKVIEDLSAEQVVNQLAKEGICCFAVGENKIRFVFHLDISNEQFNDLKEVLKQFEPVQNV